MYIGYYCPSIYRKGHFCTELQVIKNGMPQKITIYAKSSVEDCLEDVFEVLVADPEGLLSIKNDVALMVHEGRTMVLLRPSSNTITLNGRFGTTRTKTSKLKEMVETVAELIDGKVVSYDLF